MKVNQRNQYLSLQQTKKIPKKEVVINCAFINVCHFINNIFYYCVRIGFSNVETNEQTQALIVCDTNTSTTNTSPEQNADLSIVQAVNGLCTFFLFTSKKLVLSIE